MHSSAGSSISSSKTKLQLANSKKLKPANSYKHYSKHCTSPFGEPHVAAGSHSWCTYVVVMTSSTRLGCTVRFRASTDGCLLLIRAYTDLCSRNMPFKSRFWVLNYRICHLGHQPNSPPLGKVAHCFQISPKKLYHPPWWSFSSSPTAIQFIRTEVLSPGRFIDAVQGSCKLLQY